MDEVGRRRKKHKREVPQLGRYWILALGFAIRQEAAYPTRRETRIRFQALRQALQLVQDESGDALVLQMMLGNDDRLPLEHEVDAGLRDRLERVEKVLARIPLRAGRDKFYPPSAEGRPSARELCALMASVAWERVHGRWPGEHNPAAQHLCSELWRMAGGPPGWSGSEAGWRRHVAAARRYRDTPLGLAIKADPDREVGTK